MTRSGRPGRDRLEVHPWRRLPLPTVQERVLCPGECPGGVAEGGDHADIDQRKEAVHDHNSESVHVSLGYLYSWKGWVRNGWSMSGGRTDVT